VPVGLQNVICCVTVFYIPSPRIIIDACVSTQYPPSFPSSLPLATFLTVTDAPIIFHHTMLIIRALSIRYVALMPFRLYRLLSLDAPVKVYIAVPCDPIDVAPPQQSRTPSAELYQSFSTFSVSCKVSRSSSGTTKWLWPGVFGLGTKSVENRRSRRSPRTNGRLHPIVLFLFVQTYRLCHILLC